MLIVVAKEEFEEISKLQNLIKQLEVKEILATLNSTLIQESPNDTQFNFVYYNNVNLAIKTCQIKCQNDETEIPKNLIDSYLSELKETLNKNSHLKQIYLKPALGGDWWLCGCQNSQRQIFAVISRSDSTLIEAEEILNLFENKFHNQNIFFI